VKGNKSMAQPKKATNEAGQEYHFSVGAIIERDGKYVLLDRIEIPFGFAAPAGHIDEGETPAEALVREVKEETGLVVTAYDPAIEEFDETNSCSRGITGHYWYVFRTQVEGELVMNPKEMKSLGWYTTEQIKTLKLEPVWEKWFKRLEII
jgi:8-oxo-dGTP pyrophosphatase MutT (NUDIX family)